MPIIQAKKQTNKQTNKGKMIKEKKLVLYRSSSMQREKFDEVICCVFKTIENSEMFTKGFL